MRMSRVIGGSVAILLLVLCAVSVASAQFVVSGEVVDVMGEPVEGVNVYRKGETTGAVTDEQGYYSIDAGAADAILRFSHVGFDTEDVLVAGEHTINIILLPDLTQLMEIEVVGSRSINRSSTETPVSVDIIQLSELADVHGQLDVNQMLHYLAPSYNANQQSGADGSDHVDPASIRGLGPDQTLVLVNGKRRHQSSLINIFGTRGRGNTGTDLNAIPISAIDRIEILRDGASAQYGSDAIAGVVNIVLKSNAGEFEGWVNSGIRKEGDGFVSQLNGNYGFQVGDGGFVNMTIDYLYKGRTHRPADAGYAVYRKNFGDARSDNFAVYFNSEIPLSPTTDFYAFGGYNFRYTDAYAWTRESNDVRNVRAIYPNGFDPHILSNILDKSFSSGLRTSVNSWKVDFNNTYGQNKFHYYVDESLNASMLAKSPTYFDAGGFMLIQNTTGLDFSKFHSKVMSGLNVAFGAEYRVENYKIFAGEEASWRNYGIIDTVINNVVVPWDGLNKPGGSQGFPGFRPDNEVDEFRTNVAGYLDFELDISKSLMFEAAFRAEKYSDFGSAINGKLAGRFSFSDQVAVRSSLSSGFRAPSLAQIYFNSIITDFVSGMAEDKLIAKNRSPITRALGIPDLKQERALNVSSGIAITPFENFSLTADGYYVSIEDRIVLTGAFENDDPQIGDELRSLNVGSAQFFTNAVDTRTFGVDIIALYGFDIGNGELKATVAANLNKMSVENIKTSTKLEGKEDVYFDKREKYFLLASAPDSKVSLNLDYMVDRFEANVMFVRFDEIVLIDWLGTEDVYEPKITTDISMGYQFTDNIKIVLGGTNILDVVPTKQDTETESGGMWDPVQMGFNGAFYFMKLGFSF